MHMASLVCKSHIRMNVCMKVHMLMIYIRIVVFEKEVGKLLLMVGSHHELGGRGGE